MNKKNILWIVVAAGLIAGIAFVSSRGKSAVQQDHAVYYCPMHPTYTSDRPGDCPICNMKLVKKETPAVGGAAAGSKKQDICLLHNCPKMHDGVPCPMLVVGKKGEKIDCPFCRKHITDAETETKEKKILYWTDPMIPGYKSDKPGKSPMGMDLIPVYSDDSSSASSGAASPQGYTAVMLTPEKRQLIGIRTAPVEKRKMVKAIRTVGTIAHDPELYQAQTEYIQAIQAYERAKASAVTEIVDQAKQLVESTQIRLRHMGLSEELISEIATWKEAEHSLLFAHPGDPVWVYAKVYEYELPLIRVGQDLAADAPALPGTLFTGKIRAIDLMVDPATRTTRIRAQIQDPEGKLRPDMYVNVSINVDLGEKLALPAEALFDTGTKKIVFVDKGNGVFEPRDVVVGVKADDYYELISGLQPGEVVVTSGNFLIDSESRLKAALDGMDSANSSAEEPAAGGHQHGQ